MSVTRKALLWASTNAWIRENAMRTGFVRRSVSRFMPGEKVEDAIEAAKALKASRLNTIRFVPGKQNQRVLCAPSDQSGTFRSKGMMPGCGVSVARSANAPVSASVCGKSVTEAGPDCGIRSDVFATRSVNVKAVGGCSARAPGGRTAPAMASANLAITATKLRMVEWLLVVLICRRIG